MCLRFFKLWRKHQKEQDQPPILLRPSPATAVSDQLAPASNISQTLPQPEISNHLLVPDASSSVLIMPNVSAGRPAPTSTAQLSAPSFRFGTSTAALECAEVLSHAISSSKPSADLSEALTASPRTTLWDRAYDKLKSEEPEIVDAYEKLLSNKLNGINALPEEKTENRISTSPQKRWDQMRTVAEAGLKKTERSTTFQARVNNVIQTVSPFKQVIDEIVQVVPQAAVPWVGVSLAFEILSNPFTEPGINRTGVTYVISRMDWYMNLIDPLLDDGSLKLQVDLHRQLKDHTVELYQKLLLYQMKSIYYFHKNGFNTFLRNVVRLDDWSGQLDDIKVAETVVEKDLHALQNQAILCRLEEQTQEADRRFELLESGVTLVRDVMNEQKNQECLKHLYQTDPSLDKDRILETKGKLLKTAYCWIIDNPEFKRWRTDRLSRRLWIKGDPGKGKTMLLCGIIEELEKDSPKDRHLCYFFCQATEERLNTANAVLRGLIFHLVQNYPELISHVRKDYDTRGPMLFEDHNALQALCKILESILGDDDLGEVLIIVDALDECKDTDDLEKLLKIICKISASSRAKLIVSSRNRADIQRELGQEEGHSMTLSLELNETSISDAVNKYIERNVEDLAQVKFYKNNCDLCGIARDHLIKNSSNTFLWVALVCQELSRATDRLRVKEILRGSPSGLKGLYRRMMKDISGSRCPELCAEILAVASVVKRPVTFLELFYIISSSSYPDLEPEDMETTIGLCGSFLNVQNGTVYFVHQSAVDFLHSDAPELPSIAMRHHSIFWNSLDAILKSNHIKRDVYGLETPAIPYEAIKLPEPDPLSALHYCCTYWGDHLADSIRGGNTISTSTRPKESDAIRTIERFLKEKFLYWIEGLALHGRMQQAVRAIQKLQTLVDRISDAGGQYQEKLVHDATRFLLNHRVIIESNPFQLYASALFFSPEESIMKRTFWEEAPVWVKVMLAPDAKWTACLQTLVDHRDQVRTVTYSPDGHWVISGSEDGTAKLWDAETYTCINTLGGHGTEPSMFPSEGPRRATVWIAAFSADSQQLVTGSQNGIVKLWNRANGACIHEAQYKSSRVLCMTVSSDHHGIAFALPDSTVSVYNGDEIHPVHTLKGHANPVRSMSFSPHGKRLATASEDLTVKIWNLTTGDCERTLDGHDNRLELVTFSSNGQQLASSDTTVRIWETETGKLVSKLPLHGAWAVGSIAFSRDGQRLAAASGGHIYVWNVEKQAFVWRVRAHEHIVHSLAISQDASRLLSAAYENTIKVWDLSMDCPANISEDSDAPPNLTSFSTDGHQVAAYHSENQTIKVWNLRLAGHRLDLHCDGDDMSAMAFSRDNEILACASSTGKIIVWNLEKGACMESFGEYKAPDLRECGSRGHDSEENDSEEADAKASDSEESDSEESDFKDREVTSLAFRDELQLASSASGVLKIWNISDGTCADTLENGDERIIHITFSGDGRWLAYGSSNDEIDEDCEIKIWNMESKHCCSASDTAYHLNSLSFSADNSLLVSASVGAINVWDARTASCVWKFKDDRFTGLHVSFDSRYQRRLQTELGYMNLTDSKPGYLARSPTKPDIRGANPTGQDCSRPDDSDSEYSGLFSDDSSVSEYLEGTLRFSGYGFSRQLDWIVRDGERLLWIPPDYRLDPETVANKVTPVINGSVLTWTNYAGKIVWMHFPKRTLDH